MAARSEGWRDKSVGSQLAQVLVNDKNQTNVGQDMTQVGGNALVKSEQPLVPKCLPDAVDGALVVRVLILETSSNHLVRIGCDRGHELGQGGEE